MKIKIVKMYAVIFDADGVLLNSTLHALTFYPQVAMKLGYGEVSEKKFLTYWGKHWAMFLNILWPGMTIEEFDEMYKQCSFHKEPIPQIEGAEEVLSFLDSQKEYFLGLVSSRTGKSLRKLLTRSGVDLGHFNVIQAFDEFPYHKPDPRVFNRVLSLVKEERIDISKVAYIGDTIDDLLAARGAGLQFFGVLTGAADEEAFLDAGLSKNRIIPSIIDLLDLL